jgi:hypothetical protein
MPATLTTNEATDQTTGLPPVAATERHLDHAWQDRALTLRENGATYPVIREALGFAGRGTGPRTAHHATMHAVNQAATRRDGNNAAAVAYRHRTPNVRRFGIEIEYNAQYSTGTYCSTAAASRSRITAALNDRGIEAHVEGYNHDTRPHWKATTDGTVTGGEFVSPIMSGTSDSIDEVREVVRAIKADGGSTGRKVGMHVHHDVTDFDQQQMARLVENLRHAEAALAKYVPSHRTDGSNMHGASLIGDYRFNMLANDVATGRLLPAAARTRHNRTSGCSVGRSSFYNFNSVLTYGTVEFRGLGHTLNPTKIRAWVEVGQVLVAATRRGMTFTERQTPESLMTALRAEGLSAKSARKFLEITSTR